MRVLLLLMRRSFDDTLPYVWTPSDPLSLLVCTVPLLFIMWNLGGVEDMRAGLSVGERYTYFGGRRGGIMYLAKRGRVLHEIVVRAAGGNSWNNILAR